MTSMITHSGGSIFPTAIEGYETESASGNIAQPVAGRAGNDYSLRPASLRVGTLTLVFASGTASSSEFVLDADGYIVRVDVPAQGGEEASAAAEAAHRLPQVLTLASAPIGTALMRYVAREGGRIKRTLNASTGTWRVLIDFEEVTE